MDAPRRCRVLGLPLVVLVLTAGTARAGPPPGATGDDAALRVQVIEGSPSLRLPQAPDTQSLEPVRDALARAGVIPPAVARILGDAVVAARLRDLLAFLGTRTGAAFRLEVRTESAPGSRVQVDVSLFPWVMECARAEVDPGFAVVGRLEGGGFAVSYGEPAPWGIDNLGPAELVGAESGSLGALAEALRR